MESSDAHFRQTVISIERCQSLVKKRLKELYTKDIEKGFSDAISKIRKGTLSREDKLAPSVPVELEVELSIIESMTLEQNQWVEGWKPDNLAFRHHNVL